MFIISTHSRAKAAGNIKSAGHYDTRISTHSRAKAAGQYASQPVAVTLISTHSRAKAAGPYCLNPSRGMGRSFQLTAARRRLADMLKCLFLPPEFQLTAARRRLDHGRKTLQRPNHFNSQPREGGWLFYLYGWCSNDKFQLTAARRRLAQKASHSGGRFYISTHSRAKAAGFYTLQYTFNQAISTHSRAKAAGLKAHELSHDEIISTHSRAKAAGSRLHAAHSRLPYFNSQPREGGWSI